jgi:hypothetical protein
MTTERLLVTCDGIYGGIQTFICGLRRLELLRPLAASAGKYEVR